jgi:hypothetical protein
LGVSGCRESGRRWWRPPEEPRGDRSLTPWRTARTAPGTSSSWPGRRSRR